MSESRLRMFVTLIAATVACFGCAVESAPDAGVIRFMIGLVNGSPSNRAIGEALAHEYSRAVPSPKLIVLENADGAVDVLDSVQRGDAEFGTSLADVTYLGAAGRLDGHPRLDRLRGVALLDVAAVHLLVRDDSGIRGVRDLRRRSVNLGPPGSETRVIAELVLKAFSVERDTMRSQMLPFRTAADRLTRSSGDLQAMFATAADPADFIAGATERGARLVPIHGPEVDQLRQQYRFVQLTQIPGGIYVGHGEATRTIGIEKVLVCRSDLPEAIVYEFTSRLFALLPRVSALSRGRFTAQEYAPATPVPLHPGAARYYRERELFR